MKAEERHQLQRNDLAAGMGRLVESAQGSGGLLLGMGLLLAAVVLAYWWWTANTANRVTQTWINWWESRGPAAAVEFIPDAELKKVADQARGSVADQAAQLTLADQLYEKGYLTLFKESASAAARYFEEAGRVYEALASTAGTRELALRAAMGAARCKESLGQAAEAIRLYRGVVERYSSLVGPGGLEHPLVAEARQRLAALEGPEGQAFYLGGSGRLPWPQRLPDSDKSPLAGPPGEIPPPAGDSSSPSFPGAR